MKTIKRILAVLFTASFTLNILGVTAPASLPLTIEGFTAYAWEHVGSVQASAWSQSTINTVGDSNWVGMAYAPTNGVVDQHDVLALIASARLRLSELHSNDWINVSAQIIDRDGFVLFSGYDSQKAAPSAGSVSTNFVGMKLYLEQYVWLPIANASWGYFQERDEKGNVIGYYTPYVYRDAQGVARFRIPMYFLQRGVYADFILTITDGTQVGYSNEDGGQITPKKVDVVIVSATAPGNYYAKNVSKVWISVTQEEFDKGLKPILQYVNTTDGDLPLLVGAGLPTTETHVKVVMWKQGADFRTAEEVGTYNGSKWSFKTIPKGYWWISFEFDSGFGDTSPTIQSPYPQAVFPDGKG